MHRILEAAYSKAGVAAPRVSSSLLNVGNSHVFHYEEAAESAAIDIKSLLEGGSLSEGTAARLAAVQAAQHSGALRVAPDFSVESGDFQYGGIDE